MIILDVPVRFQRFTSGGAFRADDHGKDPPKWIVWIPGEENDGKPRHLVPGECVQRKMAAGGRPGDKPWRQSAFHFIPGISLDVYAYAVLGVWVVVFGVALIASIRYLNSL